jgi:hypothetical protein
MSVVTKLVFAAAIASSSVPALAGSVHRPHAYRSAVVAQPLPPSVYGRHAHCTAANRIDFKRLQPGEMAIMIQDRGFRESVGDPFDKGECW